MATNLRLRPDAESALRDEAERTGRSQQDLMRDAIDQYLGLAQRSDALPGTIEQLIARGALIPPKTPFRRSSHRLKLPEGVTTLDLLDREDRF